MGSKELVDFDAIGQFAGGDGVTGAVVFDDEGRGRQLLEIDVRAMEVLRCIVPGTAGVVGLGGHGGRTRESDANEVGSRRWCE